MNIKRKEEEIQEEVDNDEDYDEYAEADEEIDMDDDNEGEMEADVEEVPKPRRRKPKMAKPKGEAKVEKHQLIYQAEQAGILNNETKEVLPIDMDKPFLAILQLLADLSNKIDIIGESVNG